MASERLQGQIDELIHDMSQEKEKNLPLSARNSAYEVLRLDPTNGQALGYLLADVETAADAQRWTFVISLCHEIRDVYRDISDVDAAPNWAQDYLDRAAKELGNEYAERFIYGTSNRLIPVSVVILGLAPILLIRNETLYHLTLLKAGFWLVGASVGFFVLRLVIESLLLLWPSWDFQRSDHSQSQRVIFSMLSMGLFFAGVAALLSWVTIAL